MTEDTNPSSGKSRGNELMKQASDTNRHLATQFGMPVYEDLSSFRIPKDLIKKIPYAFAKKNVILPISEDKGIVLVVISDPLHLEAVEELRLILDTHVKIAYCPKDTILAAINDCYNLAHGEASQMLAHLTRSDERGDGEVEVYDLLDDSQHHAPVIKVINLILTEAIQQGASDIHFEPSENGLRVRYRIDGVLQNRHSPPSDQQAQNGPKRN